MRQRMKKLSVCILAAFAVLVSVLSVPSVAYASDQESGWVPFIENGDMLHPSVFNYVSPGLGVAYEYAFTGAFSPSVNTSSMGMYRIGFILYEGTDYEFNTGFYEVSMKQGFDEESGASHYTFYFDLSSIGMSGGLTLYFAIASDGCLGVIDIESDVTFGEDTLTVFVESYMADESELVSGVPAFSNGILVNTILPSAELNDVPVLFYNFGEYAPVPDLNASESGKYLISYGGAEYIVTPEVIENWTGSVQTSFVDESGNSVGILIDAENATSGDINSYLMIFLDYDPDSLFSMTVYDPFRADVPTFLDSAGNFINWLITTFGAILAFMLSNPISFIWIIVSLVVVVVKILQNTAES